MQRCWSSPQQGEQISIKFKAERAKSKASPKLAQHYHMRQSGCLCAGALEQFVMLFTRRYEVLSGGSQYRLLAYLLCGVKSDADNEANTDSDVLKGLAN